MSKMASVLNPLKVKESAVFVDRILVVVLSVFLRVAVLVKEESMSPASLDVCKNERAEEWDFKLVMVDTLGACSMIQALVNPTA